MFARIDWLSMVKALVETHVELPFGRMLRRLRLALLPSATVRSRLLWSATFSASQTATTAGLANKAQSADA